MKEKYGDTWTFFDGIRSGYDHVMGQRSFPQQWDESEEVTEYSMDAWEEHYDEYGYGSYGRGLEIGKALAIRTDKEFTFIGDSEDDESKFTFIE